MWRKEVFGIGIGIVDRVNGDVNERLCRGFLHCAEVDGWRPGRYPCRTKADRTGPGCLGEQRRPLPDGDGVAAPIGDVGKGDLAVTKEHAVTVIEFFIEIGADSLAGGVAVRGSLRQRIVVHVIDCEDASGAV